MIGRCVVALASHWRRRPGQLAAMVLGLAIATALWSGVQALNAEARASYDRAAALIGGAATAVLAPTGGEGIDQSDYVALRLAGWPVSPMLEGRITVDGADGPVRLRVIGVDPATTPPSAAAGALVAEGGSDGADLARFVSPPGLALATAETAAALGRALALPPDRGPPPPIAIRAGAPAGAIIVDIGVAQRVLAQPGRLSRLLLDRERLAAVPPQSPLEAVVGHRLTRIDPPAEGELARLTDSFHLNLTAFGLLAFVVGLFIAHAAIGLSFEQRRPMIRSLRAIGVSARALTAAMALELAAIAALSGLLGVALGYAIAAALLPGVSMTLSGLYGAEISDSLTLSPSWWLGGVGVSLLGAAVAAGERLARAYSLPILATAQPAAWRAAQIRALRRQAVAAALLWAGAALLFALGDGLVAAFALIACGLLGAALLLPGALALALSLGEAAARRRGGDPVVVWFWADARQQIGALSLALMALLLALSANIGVGAMVESFRTTFERWLDRRLAAEAYFSPSDAAAPAVLDWLARQPEVAAVLPSLKAETRIAGWPSDLIGFIDHATYRDHWPLIDAVPQVWDRLAAGEGAVISEQLFHRAGLRLGDMVEIPTEAGRWRLAVLGVYPDYGNPEGQISVAIEALKARFAAPEMLSIGVRLAPEKTAALIEAYAAAFPAEAERAIDQSALKAFSKDVFNQTFAVTAALNALTLTVAGIALAASLLTLSAMRLQDLAPLWAMGLPRARVARLELMKLLALAAITAGLAIPVGMALAYGLVAVVNVAAFGWRLPLFAYPGQWALLAGLALAVAALAAAAPFWRLARVAPADLLKTFTQER